MRIHSLKDLYIHQLRDLWSAEGQGIDVLPRLSEAARSEQLKVTLERCLETTREQSLRLEQILDLLGVKYRGVNCDGMEGLVDESRAVLKSCDESALDAAIISSVQRFAHYSMAAYGCCRSFARQLGEDSAAVILQRCLDEEREFDRGLTGLAETVNLEAAHV